MSERDTSQHGMWSSGWLFVLAAAGSAVGLGNIWKFPYITGEYGGGAFVLVYLVCIAAIGIPVMMSEVFVGRSGRMSPINSLRHVAISASRSSRWSWLGWMGVVAGFMILAFYAVVAGWVLHYIVQLASGSFKGADAASASAAFEGLIADPLLSVAWFTIFMALTVFIVARGVTRGLETAVRICMPALFVLLVVVLVYGASQGGFMEAVSFMFTFDLSKLTGEGVIVAMGHAFFTLSIGMGAIMAYGAYMPSGTSITQTVGIIALVDTLVALLAGLAIFPIVFASGGEPGAGPGLLFMSVPIAFGNLPFGSFFGALFFILVGFAAITSAISLIEPALAYFVERYNASRIKMALIIGGGCWILGLGCAFSSNLLADFHIVAGLTVFDSLDKLTQLFMLPLGGLLIVTFVAWIVPRTTVGQMLSLNEGWQSWVWLVLARVISPLAILVVFAYSIYDEIIL